jgi:hypothetical protein
MGKILADFLWALLERILAGYTEQQKKDKFYEQEREHQAALDKAQSEYDTTDLQKEISEKL